MVCSRSNLAPELLENSISICHFCQDVLYAGTRSVAAAGVSADSLASILRRDLENPMHCQSRSDVSSLNFETPSLSKASLELSFMGLIAGDDSCKLMKGSWEE